MDTDTNYHGITAENVEDLIKPKLKEQFEWEKHSSLHSRPKENVLLDSFKVEFKGDKMIGLCSKSHCTKNFATDTASGQVKFSMKGVNKGQFKNPMAHYQHDLNTKENFRACNQGIRAKDQTIATDKQYKNANTYFYPERKVLEDGRSTVPPDIWDLCI